VVSDQYNGLVLAIRRYFQGAVWQRCQVHFIQNINCLRHLPAYPCPVADTQKQGFYGNILVQIIPMDSGSPATDNVVLSLCLDRIEESGEVSQRDTEITSIGEFDPHIVRVKRNFPGARLK
jgi:hypothetical protein